MVTFRKHHMPQIWLIHQPLLMLIINCCPTVGTFLSQSWCLTLPLFVAELQNPLHILLGHWVIIFQRLKENRRHCYFRKDTVLHFTWQTPTWELFQSTHNRQGKANMLHMLFLELHSKCFKMYPGFQGCKLLQATVKSFSVNSASRGTKCRIL